MPAKVTFTVNLPALRRQMAEGGNRRIVEREARVFVQSVADIAAEELREDFEEHPVTTEIADGPYAANTSGTLTGGYGNLFSYIGFKRGSDPLAPIRKELSKRPKIRVRLQKDGNFRVTMIGPSKETIFKKTPLPWAEDSWARRIEVGLAGFGRYLARPSNSSRSGAAIQVPKKIRGGRFTNTSYMTELFKRFYSKFGVKQQ